MKTVFSLVILGGLIFVGSAEARLSVAHEDRERSSVAATEEEKEVAEFRQGDQIPVSFLAEGDLIETSQSAVNYVVVKRTFWLKKENDEIMISLDGTNFKPFKELSTLQLSASAESSDKSGIINTISLAVKAKLK